MLLSPLLSIVGFHWRKDLLGALNQTRSFFFSDFVSLKKAQVWEVLRWSALVCPEYLEEAAYGHMNIVTMPLWHYTISHS